MDYCKIGGRNYDVIVTGIEETFTILFSENTGRTLENGAEMFLSPLGTFYAHKVTFRRSKENYAEFDRLFTYLSVPRYNGIPVEIVHNQTTLKYDAYVSQGTRPVEKIVRKLQRVLWGELSVNFIAMKAQVLPE